MFTRILSLQIYDFFLNEFVFIFFKRLQSVFFVQKKTQLLGPIFVCSILISNKKLQYRTKIRRFVVSKFVKTCDELNL